MKIHQLKTWPKWFDAVSLGIKPYEIRRDDRDFEVGDVLLLLEFRPHVGEYTGRKLERRITHITRHDDAGPAADGLKEGYCVLGIELA